MPNSNSISYRNLSTLAILIAIVSVSFSAIFIRWSESHPLVIAAYRMGITTLFLLPLVLTWNLGEFKEIKRSEFAFMIVIGIILAIHFATWITSLKETSVASSVILVTSHPLFVAIVSHYVFREKLRAIGYLGVFVAFGGIIVLSIGDYGLGGGNFRGDILALIGAFAAGLYILGGRKMRRSISLVPYVFIVYSVCTICLLFMCVFASAPLYPLPDREYVLFILMAFIPTIFGHTLYNWALKHVKAQVVSVSLLGEPIGATILALVLLGEIPPQFTVVGGCLILPGIYLAYRGSRRENVARR